MQGQCSPGATATSAPHLHESDIVGLSNKKLLQAEPWAALSSGQQFPESLGCWELQELMQPNGHLAKGSEVGVCLWREQLDFQLRKGWGSILRWWSWWSGDSEGLG